MLSLVKAELLFMTFERIYVFVFVSVCRHTPLHVCAHMSLTARHYLALMWSQQRPRLTFTYKTKLPLRKTRSDAASDSFSLLEEQLADFVQIETPVRPKLMNHVLILL